MEQIRLSTNRGKSPGTLGAQEGAEQGATGVQHEPASTSAFIRGMFTFGVLCPLYR